MNLSLTPQLKRFVEKKVRDGIYASETDVVSDALRGLIERDHLVRGAATELDSASTSPYDWAISNMGVDGSDIEAMAFIVLMQATKDMDSDLKMIMAEVKAIPTALFRGEIKNVCQLVAIQEELKGKLDSMSELSELTSLRLQMMMDRRAKLLTTLSNVMKKISSTQDAVAQNLK